MSGKYNADTLAQMRQLWDEHPELSAAKIGDRFGITGHSVKGLALRRGWTPRGPIGRNNLKEGPFTEGTYPRGGPRGQRRSYDKAEPRTTFAQRIDAMHARMDAILAATKPQVEGRESTP